MSMTLMLSPIRVDAEQCGTARGGSGVDEMMMRERVALDDLAPRAAYCA